MGEDQRPRGPRDHRQDRAADRGHRRLRRTSLPAVALLAAATLVGAAAPDAESGADIYQDGRSAGPAIQARLAGGHVLLPATSLPCASCHGRDGTGKREGGGQVPPVTGEALATPRPEAAGWAPRPAYDDLSLARAVTEGIDAAGRPLSTAMPRYGLSGPQRAALFAYLKQLGRGDPQETGVFPALIRVGAALPLSGPQAAVGEAVRAMLAAMFARDSQNGLYGRRLELVAIDTAADGTDAALRRLIDREKVFALVASYLPADANGLDQEIPVVGDLDRSGAPPSGRVFRIAAPLADRVAALLRQAGHCDGPNLRVAVIGRADAVGRAGLDPPDAARIVVLWPDPARPREALAAAVAAGAQAILILAPRGTVAAIGAAMLADGVTLPLLVPGEPDEDAVAGATVALSRSSRQRIRIAFAGLAPEQIDETGFDSVMPSDSGGRARSLLMYEAYASAVVLLEALKQAGRRLDRAALVDALEALRDVRTGVLPPISFGPGRHDGLSGAAVLGFAEDGRAIFLAPWQPAQTVLHQDPGCRGDQSAVSQALQPSQPAPRP